MKGGSPVNLYRIEDKYGGLWVVATSIQAANQAWRAIAGSGNDMENGDGDPTGITEVASGSSVVIVGEGPTAP